MPIWSNWPIAGWWQCATCPRIRRTLSPMPKRRAFCSPSPAACWLMPCAMLASRQCCSIRSISTGSICSSLRPSGSRKRLPNRTISRHRAETPEPFDQQVRPMSLLKNVGTIGGLTAVSRVFGFVRDILLARVLGAGGVADAWQLAFQLPNLFRRLFAEGAFASAFVPLFNRHMADSESEPRRCAGEALDVLLTLLVLFGALWLGG